MLEKPDLQDDKIIACLKDAYGLTIAQVEFLPLGVDVNAAVYRLLEPDGTAYFLKLRRGAFSDIAVVLPKFLSEQGVPQIIAPLATEAGQLYANLDDFKAILYPFVDGHDGYQQELSDRDWLDFGAALKRIHTTSLPSALRSLIPRETYSPQWREGVKSFLARATSDTWHDAVAVKLVAFLHTKRDELRALVERTEQLAQILQDRSPELVVCHADIHAGNVLIDTQGRLFIVDWDAPILAPKERDLMYSGGGQFGDKRTPPEEDALFYRGYGDVQIDYHALAYYRYERIIDDIAAYCEQLLLTDEGGEDREQAFTYLTSNWRPNGTLEIAYNADKTRH